MDSQRFDGLVRAMGVEATRRSTLIGLCSGLIATWVLGENAEAMAPDALHVEKKKRKKRCTGGCG